MRLIVVITSLFVLITANYMHSKQWKRKSRNQNFDSTGSASECSSGSTSRSTDCSSEYIAYYDDDTSSTQNSNDCECDCSGDTSMLDAFLKHSSTMVQSYMTPLLTGHHYKQIFEYVMEMVKTIRGSTSPTIESDSPSNIKKRFSSDENDDTATIEADDNDDTETIGSRFGSNDNDAPVIRNRFGADDKDVTVMIRNRFGADNNDAIVTTGNNDGASDNDVTVMIENRFGADDKDAIVTDSIGTVTVTHQVPDRTVTVPILVPGDTVTVTVTDCLVADTPAIGSTQTLAPIKDETTVGSLLVLNTGTVTGTTAVLLPTTDLIDYSLGSLATIASLQPTNVSQEPIPTRPPAPPAVTPPAATPAAAAPFAVKPPIAPGFCATVVDPGFYIECYS